MKRARFVTAARREFLAEVAFYNVAQNGLGARFASAVGEAAARALAFPFAGSPSAASTRRVLLKNFPFSLFYRLKMAASWSLPLQITLASRVTGKAGPADSAR